MNVKLFAYTPFPATVIDTAAAVCYNSPIPKIHGKILLECYKNRHHSVLEHASFTFHISEVSRSLLAQLTRHRVGTAFSVRSQRYCIEDRFDYIMPETIKEKGLDKEYEELMDSIKEVYGMFTECGIPAEDARYILPNACATELYLTMNLRELAHFCNERMCNRAQWEIRELAEKMAALVVSVMPVAADLLVPKCEIDKDHPLCTEVRSGCGKHKTWKEMDQHDE